MFAKFESDWEKVVAVKLLTVTLVDNRRWPARSGDDNTQSQIGGGVKIEKSSLCLAHLLIPTEFRWMSHDAWFQWQYIVDSTQLAMSALTYFLSFSSKKIIYTKKIGTLI